MHSRALMPMFKRGCVVLLVILASACGGNNPTAPTALTTSDLLAAPIAVALSGKTMSLTASPNRDFMPPVPDSSLTVVLTVKTSDGSLVPSNVVIDAVWAVNGSAVWTTWTLNPLPRSALPPTYVVSATNGPLWDVGATVTVIMRLNDSSGNTTLLRAPSQAIMSTF